MSVSFVIAALIVWFYVRKMSNSTRKKSAQSSKIHGQKISAQKKQLDKVRSVRVDFVHRPHK